MKRVLSIFGILIFVALVGGTFWFLWSKSRDKPVVFQTEQAETKDIVKKTVATGAIVPRREVEIKPRVSGVIEKLDVEPGAEVKPDQPIAKIQIVPNEVNLNRAEAEVQAARIAFQNAKRELDRNENLLKQGVVSEAEVARFRTDYELRRQELGAASNNLKLVKEGARGGKDKKSNIIVTSTVAGMVIDVPVKEGFSVTETNNFNPGTTIAVVADMGDMIFQGQVDESEVGKIKIGMQLKIKIGALEKETFDGTLEYIAPKGKEIDGAIQFEIKAKIVRKPELFIRAGYSANADIVLDERKQVLAIREALLQFDEGKTFVEVETAPGQFERRDVEVGLSDGIHVEVKSGVTVEDKIKIPSNAGPAGVGGPGGGRGGPPRRMR
jgi:HlyD family secretion protein